MKLLKSITIRLVLCAGVFFNAGAGIEITENIIKTMSEKYPVIHQMDTLRNSSINQEVLLAGSSSNHQATFTSQTKNKH